MSDDFGDNTHTCTFLHLVNMLPRSCIDELLPNLGMLAKLTFNCVLLMQSRMNFWSIQIRLTNVGALIIDNGHFFNIEYCGYNTRWYRCSLCVPNFARGARSISFFRFRPLQTQPFSDPSPEYVEILRVPCKTRMFNFEIDSIFHYQCKFDVFPQYSYIYCHNWNVVLCLTFNNLGILLLL